MLTALAMIGLVLLQHGKGADMGAAFGSGASGSLFGATGSANFLSRTTAVLATVFFVCTLALAYLSNDARSQPAAACSSRASTPRAASARPTGAAQIPGRRAPAAAGRAAGRAAASGAAPIPAK